MARYFNDPTKKADVSAVAKATPMKTMRSAVAKAGADAGKVAALPPMRTGVPPSSGPINRRRKMDMGGK